MLRDRWAHGVPAEARAALFLSSGVSPVIGVFFFLPVVGGAAPLASPTSTSTRSATSRQRPLRRARATTPRCSRIPLFWMALRNTFYFVSGRWTADGRRLARRGAPRHSQLTRFKGFFRTVYFAPVVTTLVAVAVVWRYLYHPRFGLLNHALDSSAIAPIDWLGDPRWAMPAIILLAVWKNFGYNMIIFIAGLQASPTALRGGAHRRRRGRGSSSGTSRCRCSRPTFLFVGVITMIGYFQFFAEPYVMTEGGPLEQHASRSCSSCTSRGSAGGAWDTRPRSPSCSSSIILAATLVQFRLAEKARRVKRPGPDLLLHVAARRSAAVADSHPPALDGLGLAHAGRRGEHVSAAPPAVRRRPSRTTARSSRGSTSAAPARQQPARRRRDTLVSLLFNSMAGYAFAKLRFRGRDALFRGSPRRAGDSGTGRDASAFPDAASSSASSTRYAGVIVPAHGDDLRHLSGPPVRPRHPRRACSTPRASTGLASSRSTARSFCRC